MKALVTGTGTILGNAIAKKLLQKNFKVIAAYRKHIPKLKKNKNLKLLKFNLNKKIELNERYDVLIHCASAIPSYNISSKQMIKTNYFGFVDLLNNAIKNKCNKIILISTMSVYGKINQKLIDENYFRKPLDPYGKSKKMMEDYLRLMSKKFNLTTIIFRLSGVVGKNSHSYISRVLKKINLGEKIIFSNPNLKFNTFIHVDNLSEIVFKFIKSQKENCIYNIGTTYPLKLKNIILKLFSSKNVNPNYSIIKSSNKGYSIKLSKGLKNKCNIYSTKKTLDLFIKQNLS